jgi:hypothetical protein
MATNLRSALTPHDPPIAFAHMLGIPNAVRKPVKEPHFDSPDTARDLRARVGLAVAFGQANL